MSPEEYLKALKRGKKLQWRWKNGLYFWHDYSYNASTFEDSITDPNILWRIKP